MRTHCKMLLSFVQFYVFLSFFPIYHRVILCDDVIIIIIYYAVIYATKFLGPGDGVCVWVGDCLQGGQTVN